MDYISREALKEEVRRLSTHYLNEWDTLGVLSAVDRIPAADVREVKKAKWIKTAALAPFEDDRFECSVCGSWPWWCGVTDANLPNFCPNCGAYMNHREEQT